MDGQGSRICLSLTASTLAENLRLIESRRRFIDMAELRADFLDPAELSSVSGFPSQAGLPCVLCIRREQEGGRWRGEESERRRLLSRSLGGYAFVDIEEEIEDPGLLREAEGGGTRVIRSAYDFGGLPVGVARRCRSLAHRRGEIPKVAVLPNSTKDLPALIEAFGELQGEEKILIGMGEHGLWSRLLATKLGCFLTYCSASPSQAAPAEHLEPQSLVELYRFRKQDRDTFLCGIIGNPIAHSRSPEFHNRGYEALGLNGLYLPFLVDDVPSFFEVARLLDLQGFSVTIPHKLAVLPHLHELDGSLRQIGACNTVVRRAAGRYWGTNTDVEGFLKPLQAKAPELLQPGTRAMVIGAGGGARSVIYALHSCGIRPLIVNRTARKAKALAEHFECPWAGIDDAASARQRNDLIVQATAAGMEPETQTDALPGYRFSGSELVYDLVYQPLQTAFLKRARAAGCRTISGLDMLYAQGAAQFRYYTGCDYPWEVLDQNH